MDDRVTSKSFRDLVVWQKAHAFVLASYRLSTRFPKHELFGLTSQLRRAAVSIPANIAEGFKRQGRLDKSRFYNIAQASLEECRYYLILANDLGYGRTTDLGMQLDEVSRMLDAYCRSMNTFKQRVPALCLAALSASAILTTCLLYSVYCLLTPV